jgi:hypothetical protein
MSYLLMGLGISGIGIGFSEIRREAFAELEAELESDADMYHVTGRISGVVGLLMFGGGGWL